MKNSISTYSTNLAVALLGRLIKANIRLTGVDNLSAGPTLFVANHFTRAETFLIPHVILKYGGSYVRTLADHRLFVGKLGEYLEKLGVMSTREPHRDRVIIGDLMTGRQNWAIYPEGTMVKTKRLIRRGRFRFTRPARRGAPKSGAAMIALKAEIYKKRYLRAVVSGNSRRIAEYERRFGFSSPDELAGQETVVVPVTITYYPIRPGDNAIKNIVEKFVHEIPPRLAEELEVEGNLLLSNSDIHIHFGAPIRTTGFIARHFFFSRWIPRFLRSLEGNNIMIKHEAMRLTRRFMQKIYGNLSINIDHLFCASFRHLRQTKIVAADLHRAIYLTAREIARTGDYKRHPTIRKELLELLADVPHLPAESIIGLAEERGILKRVDGKYHVNKIQFEMMHMFHTIRLKNPLVVIANELEPLKEVTGILARNLNSKPEKLREAAAEMITQDDLDLYSKGYQKYFDERVSRGKNAGAPFFLRASTGRVGIVLSHGFLSAPEEIRPLAQSLHEKGYSVYGVRLEGHGTTPSHLARVRWRDWYRSYLRGFEVLRCCCDHVYLGGFSTGGAVALLSAGLWPDVDGVISISAPHDLGDINARLVPTVNFWNELLAKLHLEKGKIDFVDNHPENPEINYHQIPVKGLRQLEKLMTKCRAGLSHVDAPALIIHGTDDPGVNPDSSRKIYAEIGSSDKKLVFVDSDRHVIVRHEIRHPICEEIDKFIQKTLSTSTNRAE